MPYVKSISVHCTPKKTITYILDKDKTDGLLYVSGLNVGTTVQSAYDEMKTVFENYSEHKFDEYEKINTKTPVKLFHFIHSFRPTDDVTPELATQIAKEWAEKAFGKDRQILIATHVDKGHVHSHVLLNPYDLNGVKYNSNKKTLEAVRQLSNSVAFQCGIKPIPDKKQNKSVTYKEWSERRKGTSWKQEIRNTIDRLVYDVQNVKELYERLTKKGYNVKQGNHITVSIPTTENEKKKSVRIDNPKSFGEGYDKESLEQRIRLALEQKQAEQEQKKAVQEDNKSLIERLYEERIYEVGQLVQNKQKAVKKYNKKLPYSIENDYEVYHIAMQLRVIKRDNIKSIDSLRNKLKEVEKAYEDCQNQINSLLEKERQLKLVISNAEQYFILSAKHTDTLTQGEILKLKISRSIVEKSGISSPQNIDVVRRMYDENLEKSEQLKKDFAMLERRFGEYADIVKYYQKLSRPDYITSLINEKKRKINNLE